MYHLILINVFKTQESEAYDGLIDSKEGSQSKGRGLEPRH